MYRLLLIFIPLSLFALSEPKGGFSGSFVIMGDSYLPRDDRIGFNLNAMDKLLGVVSKEKPKAVFFTGNVVFGLTRKGEAGVGVVAKAPLADPYGETWREGGYQFSLENYKRNLQTFRSLIQTKLPQTPFYPVPGFFDTLGPKALDTFQENFNIEENLSSDPNFLLYTVESGKSCFVLVGTSTYSPFRREAIHSVISRPLLMDLKAVLEEKKKKFPFLFVLGSSPAFSTTANFGQYQGLDRYPGRRGDFWEILKENGVIAYFAGQEHLFDRTHRQGIWQVISGGAGAPLGLKSLELTFHHFLLLKIPKSTKFAPLIEVIDIEGRIRDRFWLIPSESPLYQLRIS